MPNKIAIKVSSVSKAFKLYPSRRTRMLELIHPMRKKFHKKFQALDNVNITVNRGEVLGIVGQNGSGKSTLLKILSSVVSPTSGSFECNGRVTSLLELGGGFNMELTGLENIFFLGAIQGFSKKKMKERLQQILDFADIGDYANQPVKNYSSGMYIRLAFSINIHIDPDILIVDEALSVGDMYFQRKCFRKIREFTESGKTIVICSHSMTAIKDFCSRAIWIHEGVITKEGDPQMVTDSFQAFMLQRNTTDVIQIDESKSTQEASVLPDFRVHPELNGINWNDLRNCESHGYGKATIRFAALVNAQTKKETYLLMGGEELYVGLLIETDTAIPNSGVELQLNGPFGSAIFMLNSNLYKNQIILAPQKMTLVSINFRFPNLGNGRYSFSIAVQNHVDGEKQYLHWVHDAILFEVQNPDIKFHMANQLVITDAIFKSIIDL